MKATITVTGARTIVFILLLSAESPITAATRTLMNFGSPWRYHDFGTDPGANWNGGGYADRNWKFNFAQRRWNGGRLVHDD